MDFISGNYPKGCQFLYLSYEGGATRQGPPVFVELLVHLKKVDYHGFFFVI